MASCAGCGRWGTGLCPTCRRRFQFYTPPADILFGDGNFWTHTHAFYTYNIYARKILSKYKTKGAKIFEKGIKDLIADYVRLDPFDIFTRIRLSIPKSTTVLTYIPPTPRKRFLRLFDHIAPIAKFLAKLLSIRLVETLGMKNKPDSKSLHYLERVSHTKQSLYFYDNPATLGTPSHISHVVVIDDVTTTGSTLYFAEKLLKQNFPDAQIVKLAIFKTPDYAGSARSLTSRGSNLSASPRAPPK